MKFLADVGIQMRKKLGEELFRKLDPHKEDKIYFLYLKKFLNPLIQVQSKAVINKLTNLLYLNNLKYMDAFYTEPDDGDFDDE